MILINGYVTSVTPNNFLHIINMSAEYLGLTEYPTIYNVLIQQPDYMYYVHNPNLLPCDEGDRSRLFRSINICPLNNVRTVFIGMNPYPRRESATGLSFQDGMTRYWDKSISLSFSMIIKSLFNAYGVLNRNCSMDELIYIAQRLHFELPYNWFERLSTEHGVLWLNTSLTFESSTDQSIIRKHARFWKPVIFEILRLIALQNESVIFVLMGNDAKELEPTIQDAYAVANTKHKFKIVSSRHPASRGGEFLMDGLFKKIYIEEMNLNIPHTTYMMKMK